MKVLSLDVGNSEPPEPLPVGSSQREAAYENRKLNSEFCHIVGGVLTPPCGVPLSRAINWPLSCTGAFNQRSI
jgi:hypothetical protein